MAVTITNSDSAVGPNRENVSIWQIVRIYNRDRGKGGYTPGAHISRLLIETPTVNMETGVITTWETSGELGVGDSSGWVSQCSSAEANGMPGVWWSSRVPRRAPATSDNPLDL